MKQYLLGLALSSIPLCGAQAQPAWQIVETEYSTSELVVSGYSVMDFGAVADAVTDCTPAFQAALNKMASHGGGTVFAPGGAYAFRGRLNIPSSVTLRGEWLEPTTQSAQVKGTVLVIYTDAGDADAPPFISVDTSAGVKDLTIWYPEQNARRPVPYPFTLEQSGLDNATFENLTLVNPYQGIRIGPGANELHYVHNIYGTPLKVGISYDSTTDIGRLEKINFSPYYWLESGLPKVPSATDLRDWLRLNAVGIHMMRSDWEYVDRVIVEGYNIGFQVTEGARGAANAQFRRLVLRDCEIALSVDKTNPFGMVFTQCYIEGNKHGILLSPEFESAVLFSECIIGGEPALESKGKGVVLMEQCTVESGNIEMIEGSLSMIGGSLESAHSIIKIGEEVSGALFAGVELAGGKRSILNEANESVVQFSEERIELESIPRFPDHDGRTYKPSSNGFTVVAPRGKHDMTSDIQVAMDTIASDGGGTVFLPGGNYTLSGNLNIPSGVELRGIHDVPHHTMGGGSILHIYPNTEAPTITLQSQSGLRGLSFHYPDQDMDNLQQTPFLIQGQGSDIYIINVNVANAYKILDLMSYRCDSHFVDYLSGAPIKTGIAVGGGSRNGVIRNVQFNPHYARRPAPGNPLFASARFKTLWDYQKEELIAFTVGHTENQFFYQNFVYGCLYGMHFIEESGGSPRNCIIHGHGTDGGKVGVFFESGSEHITMVNSELVAMSTTDKVAIKLGRNFNATTVLIGSLIWGNPDYLAVVDGGVLKIQNLHATRHGNGILANGGRIEARNLNFLNGKGNHAQEKGGEVLLESVITQGGLRINSSEGTTLSIERY
ncbi:MAG: glycosyl hydrolase family 28-related protein [Lentimonas sp.]